MRPVVEFLLELREKSIGLTAAGNQLICDAPPGALTPDLRERMSVYKPQILRLLSGGSAPAAEEEAASPPESFAVEPPPREQPPCEPCSREPSLRGPLPLGLSRAQSSIWLLEQINPGTPVWNISWALDIRGTLDRDALAASFRALLKRQAALRSRFLNVDGTPKVEHVPATDWRIDYADLRGEPDAEVRAVAMARTEVQRPFDLEQGPLFRVQLLRTADEAYVLTAVAHHIVADGWSLGVIGADLNRLYTAYAAGIEPSLPPLRADYQAYVAQARNDEATTEADLAWWRRKLSGELPIISLADDSTRTPSGAGRRVSIPLDAGLTARIEALARRNRATTFMVLLAAFKLLVFRYTGQADVLVGVQTSGRDKPEYADVVGMFVNTLVLRTGLDPEQSFAELLACVRQTSVDAFAHQHIAFDRIVEAVQPRRVKGHNPIVRHAIAYQNLPGEALRLGAAELTHKPLDLAGSRYELAVEVWRTATGMLCDFEYATDLFEPETIERMMGHYRNLLDAVTTDPDQPIALTPLMSEAERKRLLVDWNDTATDYPTERRLEALVAEQAARTPDAIALVHRSRELTYRELDRRANQLAHHLQALGVTTDVPVGICLDRTPDLIVAILAVLKAGGAYVPLDPKYPMQRLAYMLADSTAPVLITRSALGLSLAHTGHIVDVEKTRAAVAALPDVAPVTTGSADDLAYVIYTSGSTGRPKGTMLRHSAGYLVDWARRTFAPAEIARVVAATSICFDLSVFEMFVPLCTGGAMILVDDPLDPPDPASRPTMLNTVPSALAELARSGSIPDSVVSVIACGEKLGNPVVQALYDAAKIQRVYNLYGPTEYTTYATVALAARGADRDPPIGRPLTNTQVYVLDPRQQPVPIGVVGELYIAGHGLARGYFGRPDLTADRFVDNPFGAPGSRMYKTGDLVRWSAAGELEFVGRIDHQVKVRGFRIELGEIEATLQRHPSVRDAVVLARRDQPNNQQLVAYIVAEGNAPSSVELRQHVGTWLPDYMIPSAFVALPAFPQTANGKVDRAALPAPVLVRSPPPAEPDWMPPIEELIADSFKQVLGIDQYGSEDNFFDMGGHSLLVMEAAALLGRLLEQPVSPGWLFQAPTPHQLAPLLETTHTRPTSHLSTLQPLGDKTPLFCLHDLFSRTLTYVSLARLLAPDQPVYGLVPGPLENAIIANPSLDVLTPAYVAAIRKVQPRGPYRIVGYSFGGVPAFAVAHALQDAGEDVTLIMIDPYIYRANMSLPQVGRWVSRRGYGALKEIWAANRPAGPKMKETATWANRQAERVKKKTRDAIVALGQPRNAVPPGRVPEWVPDSGRPLAMSLLQAEANYQFRPFKGSVVFLQGTIRDTLLDFLNIDGLNGWGGLFEGPLTRLEIPARHLWMMRDPLVSMVVEKLRGLTLPS
ncbi:MAG TPA: amino acid adenylation domain-containing protein [Rhodopila sp.]|uniref:non-ribosomal peptide synthetase n=1 Tax=Rhodopila sp. TaxID=2480087 RepID=UPI002CBDE7A5|nr:amino acid adenylation domain-containing protein [Rhodopila sp.]HVY16791.1 amino acid adenylation domain-containing protein [Rhodopila sp.]